MKLDYDVYSARGYTELFRASYYKAKGENHSAESLFMLLVLQQQKMINELIAKVSGK